MFGGLLAFLGIYGMKDIGMMTLTCCIIEIIVAICDTPFIYLAVKSKAE